jgi:hypothetical protein
MIDIIQLDKIFLKRDELKYNDILKGYILIENDESFLIKLDNSELMIRNIFEKYELVDFNDLKNVVGKINTMCSNFSESSRIRINRNLCEIIGIKIIPFSIIDLTTVFDIVKILLN